MARLPGVTPDKAGLGVKLAFFFARRAMRRMTGNEPARMLEPLEMYAHVPFLMNGYGRIELATAKIKDLPSRHRHLAELKAATMTHCEYCIDIGSRIAQRHGLTADELVALPTYRDSPLFDPVDTIPWPCPTPRWTSLTRYSLGCASTSPTRRSSSSPT